MSGGLPPSAVVLALGSAVAGGAVFGRASEVAFGGAAACLVQVLASRALGSVRDDPSQVRFLRGFVRAALVRVLGGAALVAAALVREGPSAGWYLAGFGWCYLVLEIWMDVGWLRSRRGPERSGGDE